MSKRGVNRTSYKARKRWRSIARARRSRHCRASTESGAGCVLNCCAQPCLSSRKVRQSSLFTKATDQSELSASICRPYKRAFNHMSALMMATFSTRRSSIGICRPPVLQRGHADRRAISHLGAAIIHKTMGTDGRYWRFVWTSLPVQGRAQRLNRFLSPSQEFSHGNAPGHLSAARSSLFHFEKVKRTTPALAQLGNAPGEGCQCRAVSP